MEDKKQNKTLAQEVIEECLQECLEPIGKECKIEKKKVSEK